MLPGVVMIGKVLGSRLSVLRAVALAIAIAGALIATPSSALASGWSARLAEADVKPACAPPSAGYSSCFALVRKHGASGSSASAQGSDLTRPFAGAHPAALEGPRGGLTPEDLASAYGYSPTAGGAGQTVGIVDAFDDPRIESDLGEFDANYGLPACTSANGCLRKVGQSGGGVPTADTSGWSVEITLDVETVHAACPNCKVLLVEASNNSDANLAAATNEAVALGATVVSNSYGGPEIDYGPSERAAYNHPGVPILASSGDDGFDNWLASILQEDEELQMPNMPAASPTVIAVGGTTLELNPNGTRANERVWELSGGGCSQLFSAQPWQQNEPGYAQAGCGDTRLDVDVSAVADPNTGLDIYDTYNCGEGCEGAHEGWVTIGGTSLAAPFVSSLYALAGGGHGIPYPSVTLYGPQADLSSRFDVTEGGNGICEGEVGGECEVVDSLGAGRLDCEGTRECDAAPGYDGPSGVGTPVGLGLFEPQAPAGAIAVPATLTAGSPASFSTAGSSDAYPGGAIAGASWNWGDGTTGAGTTAAHTYAAAGTYLVTLVVTDAYGIQSAPVTRSVSVGAAPSVGVQGVAGLKASAPAHSPSAHLAGSSLKVSGGSVKLKISCAASGASCSGSVTLTSAAAHASKAKQKALTLGAASFTIAAGKTQTVTVHLSAKARKLLASGHAVKALAKILLRVTGGPAHTISATVTLRAAVAVHRRH